MSPSLPRRVAVFVVVCLAAMVAGCGRAPVAAQDPESAANAFFATLERGDAQAAYDGSAFGFQAAQSYAAFLSNAEDLGLIGGEAPTWVSKDATETEARLAGRLINHSNAPVDVSVTMTLDGNAWKLFSLKTTVHAGNADMEENFTQVGKGSGFNDVYHQPMPDQAHLAALVHKTISQLNDAIQRQDFHAFYDGISQQWKNGRRLTGEALGGVTPKILNDHFQGFIDKKIDLSGAAESTPVYDQPPHIDEDGLLDVQGHMEDGPLRVEFSFQFAYELPRWKLVSIDVGVRQ